MDYWQGLPVLDTVQTCSKQGPVLSCGLWAILSIDIIFQILKWNLLFAKILRIHPS